MTNLQEENSQLKESVKEKEKKSLAMNTVVKDDMQYLFKLLQYNISYEMSTLKSNIGVIQQSLKSKCHFGKTYQNLLINTN